MALFRTTLLTLALLALHSPSASAAPTSKKEAPTYTIGIIAYMGIERCQNAWSELPSFLEKSKVEAKFIIACLESPEFSELVRTQKLDFIISNPSQYLDLEAVGLYDSIATLKTRLNNIDTFLMGGTVFTRADTNPVKTYNDLAGKTLITSGINSFGGWHVGLREIQYLGLNPKSLFRSVKHDLPNQERIVLEVRDRNYDVGMVRTGVLEQLALEGVINLSDFSVVTAPVQDDHEEPFPYLHSTRLYPEFVFARSEEIPIEFASQLATALISMTPKDPVARAAHIGGWVYPLSYRSVQELQQTTGMGSYGEIKNLPAEFILKKFKTQIWIALILAVSIFIGSVLLVWLFIKTHTLKNLLSKELEEKQTQQENLETLNSALEKAVNRAQNIAISASVQATYLKSILDNSPYVAWLKDQEGRYLAANEAFLTVVNRKSTDDIIGKTDFDLFDAETAKRHNSRDKGIIETRRKMHIEEQRIENGKVQYVELNFAPVLSEYNEIIGTTGLSRDITDLRVATLQLRESEQRFRSILETVQLLAILLDEKGRITFVNDFAQNLLGWSKDDIIGKDWQSFFVRTGATLNIESLPVHFEIWTLTKAHEPRLIRWSNTVLRDPTGRPMGAASLGEDITDLRKATQQLTIAKVAAESANQAKSAFLSNISHEIRTPMNIVLGMVDLLLETNLSSDQAEYLHRISVSGETLLQLINNVLDISKIESGALFIEKKNFSLKTLATNTIELLSKRAEEKKLSLKLEMAPGIPEIVCGDSLRVRQIFINLINNAIKFTQNGGIIIQIGPSEDPYRINFSVRDSGIGIKEDKIAELFQRFNQLDTSITRKYGGTGLGLSICKELIELMGGTIIVTSEFGHGTNFSYFIPFSEPTKEEGPAKTLIPVATPRKPLKDNLRILVAEDSEDNRNLLALYLKTEPHEIAFAENGEIALQLAKEKDFDLIIMDMQMPVMDGYTATREFRKWEKAQSRTPAPIVALSAYALVEEKEKSLSAGCNHYLTKPIQKKVLLAMIAQIIKEPLS